MHNRWVFKLKKNLDVTPNRYKAWLVTKGSHKHLGVDFEEKFSPVNKPAITKLVLSIAISK